MTTQSAAAWLFLWLFALAAVGCYPHDCKPNDASCLPCTDVRNTNPACPPFPSDARKPDGGTDR